MQKIKVSIQTKYGNRLIYPECENSRAFAEIAGQKTLSSSVIELIRSLGFEIEVLTPAL